MSPIQTIRAAIEGVDPALLAFRLVNDEDEELVKLEVHDQGWTVHTRLDGQVLVLARSQIILEGILSGLYPTVGLLLKMAKDDAKAKCAG